LSFLAAANQRRQEGLIDGLLDDHPLGRNALLAARLEAGRRDALGRVGEVGIRAHDIGGVRAELGDEFLRPAARTRSLPAAVLPVSVIACNQRVGGERLGGVAAAGHHVEQSIRNARPFEGLGQHHGDLRARRRRLHHHRIAMASAGATFWVTMLEGALNGVMAATTP